MQTMFNWISTNKEWLFSGVGVSVVLGLIYLLRNLGKQRDRSMVGITPTSEMPQNSVANLALSAPAPPVARILPLEIYDAVRDLPPLQQYEGLHVDWNAELYSASKVHGDDSRVWLALDHKSESESWRYVLIFCEVSISFSLRSYCGKTGSPNQGCR